MTTLQVIDNPAGRPLSDDARWLDALAASPVEPASRLLLLGFDDADAIAVRRRLAPSWHAQQILHVPDATYEALARLDPALWQLALARLIDGLEAASCRWHGHADQAPRCVTAPDLDPTTPRDEAAGALPRLALVTPLPPEATGIADYSAELLPYLAEHYEVSLVVEQPDVAPELAARYPLLSARDFAATHERFDRVLYQIGNSMFHAYQFPLLRQIPGVVVLHDVFLFDAVWWMQESGRWPDGLRRELFFEHGYPAVLALEQGADEEVGVQKQQRGPEEYPVNGFVTHEAAGLIFHSRFARDLDRRWRPGAWHEEAAVVPHLRELPMPTEGQRQRARQALDLPENACVIASFGGINPKKMSDLLVEAFLAADWNEERQVVLALVGAQHGGDFGRELESRLRQHPRGCRVRMTGYVTRTDYLQWLGAADIAVQLRQESRGESSGAILDAMAHGLAVVANAHGSSAELPAEAMTMLPDALSRAALTATLQSLVQDPARRQVLGRAARDYVAAALDPVAVAHQYRGAIEAFAGRTRRERRDAWMARLASQPALRGLDEPALLATSAALCELDTTAAEAPPRILFDVSTIAWHDLKTGIERVTRRLADQLLRQPPPGWRVELVRWGGDDFHLARGFAAEQLGIAPPAPDRPCEARPGDIYVSVEWAPPLLEQAGHALKRLRARGVRCYFTVHDLLPLRLPHCFPDDVPVRMRRWFDSVVELADGITCVSATVADEVRSEVASLALPHPPWVEPFHLGADFSPAGVAACGDAALNDDERALLARIAEPDGATLLMVGTLEPRKGHAQVLEALEHCWAEDLALNLVIVGKQGWNVDSLVRRLRRHAQKGRRLHWIEGASDALLQRLYARCDGLVAASLGEGFGLPLIEAAHHGIPILARDIPVFREVAGEHASYFQAADAAGLADELHSWCRRWQRGELPDPHRLPHLSWAQSAQAWLTPILADQPTPRAAISPQGAQL